MQPKLTCFLVYNVIARYLSDVLDAMISDLIGSKGHYLTHSLQKSVKLMN